MIFVKLLSPFIDLLNLDLGPHFFHSSCQYRSRVSAESPRLQFCVEFFCFLVLLWVSPD